MAIDYGQLPSTVFGIPDEYQLVAYSFNKAIWVHGAGIDANLKKKRKDGTPLHKLDHLLADKNQRKPAFSDMLAEQMAQTGQMTFDVGG